jgi:RimJ/RimL family protein N-acetyltransferase
MHHTKSLRIEPLQEHHAAAMLPVLQDERIYAYIPEARYDNVEALSARYRRLANGSDNPTERWLNWVLFVGDTDVPIGFLQSTVYSLERLADVAYVLSPVHWRRGFAIEALCWLMENLEAAHAVDVVRAQIDVRNTASIALVRRLGFEYVGAVMEVGSEDAIYQRSVKDIEFGAVVVSR